MEDLIERAARDLAGSKKVLEYHGNAFKLQCVSCNARYEVNAEPTPLTEEQISDYLIQGQAGEILPRIVEEVKKIQKG
jgi:NAD-dependent SIR2 family protein deacetylase